MRLLEVISRGLLMLPQWKHGITFNKDEIESCRLAHNTIRLWEQVFDSPPKTIIDVGSRNLEESRHWVKHWRSAYVEAFDFCYTETSAQGNILKRPIGLSNKTDVTKRLVRFDRLSHHLLVYPVLLKIDCEESTFKALQGFGNMIRRFNMVVIEMWNDFDSPVFVNQQFDIWRTMIDHGFNECRVLSAYDRGKSVPWYDIAFFKAYSPQ